MLFVSNEEHKILKLWGFDVVFSEHDKEAVIIVMMLDEDSLA